MTEYTLPSTKQEALSNLVNAIVDHANSEKLVLHTQMKLKEAQAMALKLNPGIGVAKNELVRTQKLIEATLNEEWAVNQALRERWKQVANLDIAQLEFDFIMGEHGND
jgi:hypothetical protein